MPHGIRRLLLCTFLLAVFPGCRDKVESAYPSGKPKVIRTYGILGPRDSAHLTRERTYFYNEKLEKDAQYKQGVLHGRYQDFWHNGQKKSVGDYVDGKRQGPWEIYFNQFAVASKGEFKDDLKEGPWTEYFENGELRAQGEFRGGSEVGTWKRWGPKGDLLEENSCFATNAEGRYRSFHAGDTPKEDYACRAGVPVGPYVKKNVEGGVEETGTFDSAGKRDGVWETFHPGGERASRKAFVHGAASDSLWAWDKSGRLRERGFFRDGAGEVETLDSLGRLVERARYKGGTPDGETWAFYPDGKRKSLAVYREGQAQSFTRWHANGKLASEGSYADGKRTGEWRQFGDRGQPRETAQYQKGLLHGQRLLYDSAGNLMQTLRYEHGYPAEGSVAGRRP